MTLADPAEHHAQPFKRQNVLYRSSRRDTQSVTQSVTPGR